MAPGGRRVSSQSRSTIPSSSEGNTSNTSMAWKDRRKKSENKSFRDYLKQGGQKPKIEILPGKTCPIGKYSQWWITELDIICKEEVPLKRHTWKEVIPTERETLYNRVLDVFDVDLNQEHVMEAVNESFRKIFKQMRHKLHKHYMDIEDGTAKRDSPPDEVSQENWEHLCAWFESDEFQKKSRAGKGGRKCLKVNHNGGCKSFVRHRYEKKDPITNEEPSRVEFYRQMHYQEGKGWTDPTAEENYEKMLQLRSQSPNDEGSSNVLLTDDEIADKVLGIRSGYVRGLGNCEVAPSRRLRVGSNHQEVEQLRRRAEDAESHLDELRTTQEAQQRQIEQTTTTHTGVSIVPDAE